MSFRKGVTLMELLVYCAIFSLIAITTMRALGEARVLRGNARDRSVMTLIAQSEIERLRLLPESEITTSSITRSEPAWPEGVTAQNEITSFGPALWQLDVRVERASIHGKVTIRMTTIREAAEQ